MNPMEAHATILAEIAARVTKTIRAAFALTKRLIWRFVQGNPSVLDGCDRHRCSPVLCNVGLDNTFLTVAFGVNNFSPHKIRIYSVGCEVVAEVAEEITIQQVVFLV